jgi:hypothetical protein
LGFRRGLLGVEHAERGADDFLLLARLRPERLAEKAELLRSLSRHAAGEGFQQELILDYAERKTAPPNLLKDR